MESEPTRGAIETDSSTWHSRPYAAKSIRLFAFLIPLLAAWLAVKLTKSVFLEADGFAGVALWLLQSLTVGFAGSLIVDRFSRRLLPLASLFTLSLVFPDEAPSRFGLALRSGTVRQLKRRMSEVRESGLGDSPQNAAVNAVELVTALGRHDRLTRGHTERVRAYADVIGEELDLPADDRAMLSWGALLHDIGKLTVPEEVLNKAERPTDDEWKKLQNHPAAAVEILAPLASWLGPWIGAATEHHERWDGTGYPRGLAGREISLAGRITAVADAYDVITSKRSYKQSMSAAAARKELVRCAKTQFDPDVVRAFVNVSLGRRWLPGPLASLLELPAAASAVQVVARTPAMVAGTAAVLGSIAVAPEALPSAGNTDPEIAAMITDEPDPVDTTAQVIVETVPPTAAAPTTAAPTTTTTTTAPTTTTTTTAPTTTAPTTTAPTTTAPTTTAPTTTAPTTTAPTTTAPTTTAPTTTAPTTAGTSWTTNDVTNNVSGSMTVIDALANDQLPGDIDISTLRIVREPQHGTATIKIPPGNPNNSKLRYRSDLGYQGSDSFDYEICDSSGVCSTATVTVTVTSS